MGAPPAWAIVLRAAAARASAHHKLAAKWIMAGDPGAACRDAIIPAMMAQSRSSRVQVLRQTDVERTTAAAAAV